MELQAYDGPLDLLLGLIEKNKVSIFDIPIVEITDQYLEYVRKMESEDLELMSEFMVMAAELIAIKCRMLLPKEEEHVEDGEADPREELVRRLLEYKTYKYMSYELRDMMTENAGSLYKAESIPPEVRKYRPPVDLDELIGELTLEQLRGVFESVLRRREEKIDPVRSSFGTIEREEISLLDQLEAVAGYANQHKKFYFGIFLGEKKTRTRIVVTFLAVLELISIGVLEVLQSETGGEIELRCVDGAEIGDIRERLRDSGFEESGDGKNG